MLGASHTSAFIKNWIDFNWNAWIEYQTKFFHIFFSSSHCHKVHNKLNDLLLGDAIKKSLQPFQVFLEAHLRFFDQVYESIGDASERTLVKWIKANKLQLIWSKLDYWNFNYFCHSENFAHIFRNRERVKTFPTKFGKANDLRKNEQIHIRWENNFNSIFPWKMVTDPLH